MIIIFNSPIEEFIDMIDFNICRLVIKAYTFTDNSYKY